ncbi:tetratricopeptide repeat protein [Chloroflexota bacterium]
MTTEAQDAGAMDRKYQEGMAHLQAGDWQQAIACFEELERKYPSSQPVQRSLAEARFRASLDESTDFKKAKRWTFHWRPVVVRGSLLLLIVVLAVMGGRLIQDQVAPRLAQAQEQLRLDQLEEQGSTLLEAGRAAEAQTRYEELLASDPNNTEAIQGLEQIAEEQKVEELYQQALDAWEEGDLEGALALLTQVRDQKPVFRDVSRRIEDAKQQLDRDNLFAEAEADYWAGNLTDALLKYEQIKQGFANYNSDLIGSRLVALNVQIGRDLIEQDPPAAERVSEAVEYFRAALALEPRNTEADLELRLAQFFLQGQDRFQDALWEEAIDRLRAVYDLRPTYHRGTVASRLYAAYIQSGDQHRDAGDPFFAYERYRQAASLLVEDTSLAQGRLSEALLLLTPTAVPTDTPAPTNTPEPTKKPKPKKTKVPTPAATTAPVATPVPEFPWTGGVGYTLSNCGVTLLKGFTLDRNDHMLGDIWLHYWAEGFEGAWTQSEWTDPGINTSYAGDERNWEFAIDGYAKAGVWRVCIVPFYGETNCLSNTVSAATSANCETEIQVVHVVFRQN